MKVAIDARLLTGRYTGDRTYWHGLIGGLSEIDDDTEYLLYYHTLPQGDSFPNYGPRFHAVQLSAANDRIWSLASFPARAKADGADLAHVQYSVAPAFNMPVVTTIADITFRLFPKLFALKDRLLLNLSIPGSIRRAAAVIGVSENTRRDILSAYRGTSPEKVFAILNAADSRYHSLGEDERRSALGILAERYRIETPFVLSVGVLQPRKNVPMLLRAFANAKRDTGLPHKLVVTGKRGWLSAETDTAIAEAGDDVIFTGYVPDDDLPLLYNCADLFAYPSLYEGFGLPPLEAMACGCPVITSNTSSLPEVVGDAGVMLSPTDEASWTTELATLLSDETRRTSLAQKGLERARQFSWKQAAAQTLAVYLRVYEQNRR